MLETTQALFLNIVHAAFDTSSPWDEMSYGNNGGQDTDILFSGVVHKSRGNWNGAVLVKELYSFCGLMNTIFRNSKDSLSVLSSSTWAAGSDSTLSGIPHSCGNFTTYLVLRQFPNQTFPLPIFFQKITAHGENILLATLLKIFPHSPEPPLNMLDSFQKKRQYNIIINNSIINYLIIITCLNVCASMLTPTQASNLHVTHQLNK